MFLRLIKTRIKWLKLKRVRLTMLVLKFGEINFITVNVTYGHMDA
jgi:hypothetical protein